jgi:two-component system, NtrC family, sensor histidine kinase HydH
MELRARSSLKYLPVVSIVFTAGTLLVIVVLFTVRNINSQNQRMEEFTARQGVSVIRTLEAGTRTGFMEGDWGVENVQMLIEQAAKDPDVEWVGLISGDGRILAHSDPSKIGLRLLMGPELEKVRAVIRSGEPLYYRAPLTDGRMIFEIWKPFMPFQDRIIQSQLTARHTMIGKELLDAFEREPRNVIFLALKMDMFQRIRRQEFTYAVLMGLILFVIGSASVYFIFVVQNAYLVRRTLAEMRAYTQNVVESMANGLITLDSSLRVATFNAVALEILRKPKEEVEARPIGELLAIEEEAKQALADPTAVIEKDLSLVGETKGKTFLTVSVSSLKEPESEVSRGAVIILRDQTMIRELEQSVAMNEKFAALGRLSAGVAHEIRNPLNSIRGFIQYFQKKLKLDREDYQYTRLMLTEVDRLNRVISKLLAYSKPRDPRLVVRPVDEVLDHCVRVVEMEAAEAGVEITRTPDPDTAALVMMDNDQMTQVFLNILLNAVEASPKGGKVTVTRHSDDQGLVTVVVQDTGEGIPAENLDKLFDPFFTTKKKGTGLGLAIVKTIIEGHNGGIDVESDPETGTKFIITLKAFAPDDEPQPQGAPEHVDALSSPHPAPVPSEA